MNVRVVIALLPYVAVVIMAALVGFSITRVEPSAADSKLGFTLCGALIALTAILISRALSNHSVVPSPRIPEQRLVGLKVMAVGFCAVLLGWLLAVFVIHTAGFAFAVLGVMVGFVGFAIHVVFKQNA